MFTGIIESLGVIEDIIESESNKTYYIKSSISSSFKVDQSISHDGVCLTVEEVNNDTHKVTAVAETLKVTNLHTWEKGTTINLERSLSLSKRLDGHFVQGHIDTVGVCEQVISINGSFELQFSYPKKFAPLVIEKGSISINGVSLTVFNVKKKSFKVAIIPYTYEHTNLQFLKKSNLVNLEFDMIGKYIVKKIKGRS